VKNVSDEATVEYVLVGESQFKVLYNSPMLEDHFLDYPSIPKEEQPGQMRRLLCAAAVGCFSGTVYAALISRGVQVKSLKGTATSTTAKSKGSPPVVKSINIQVDVDIDDKDLETLERVKKIVKNGCLITRSLAPAIAMTHSITRIREGESDEDTIVGSRN
jgi:uncharacterized OsmC-like protein